MAVNTVTPIQQDLIAGLYAAFWDRAPDTTGFGFWVNKLATGEATLDQIATAFRNAPEGVDAYPLWSTNVELVTEVYANVFNRAPDTAGLTFWVGKLTAGAATFPELVVDMVEAAYTNGSADGVLFNNKLDVGIYVATVAQTNNGYVCKNAFNLVTYDPASVQTAEAWVDANNTSATFTLTTGVDYADTTTAYLNGGLITSDFRFTPSNQEVKAAAGTLNNADILIDQTTTDADVMNATVNLGAANTTVIQDIETINLTSTVAGSGLDFTNVSGTKTVTLTGFANGTLSSLDSNNAPAIELNNYTRVATIDALTLAGTAAAGTADALTVKVSGATATNTVTPGITLTATTAGTLETLNLQSAGSSANTVNLTLGAGATAVSKTVVTGAADLNLLVAQAMISGQTVDAAAHTGLLNLSIDRNGAGTATTNLTNTTGVDIYTFRDSTAGGDAVVATNVANGSTAVLTYSTTGASGISVKGAASSSTNVLNLLVDNATAATDTAIATSLTIANVETINIASEGGTSTGNSIAALTVTSGANVTLDGATKMDLQLAAASTVSSVTVSGTGNHKVDFAAAATYAAGKNLTIDGSAAEGKLTLDGSDFAGTAGGVAEVLSIYGGINDDTITATADTASNNVIDAGAGKDTVNIASGALDTQVTLGDGIDTLSLTTVTAAVNFINDFILGTGGDVLSVNSAAAMTYGGHAAASANNQLVIGTAAVANAAAAAAFVSGTATAEAAAILLNSDTGVAELWYDANGTAGGEVLLASFTNVTTIGYLDTFSAANFGTWA